jgi:hypothetical protein
MAARHCSPASRCPRRSELTRAPGDFLRARENRGGRMTCGAAREALLACGVGRPPVSAVVRDPRVECGPDVAPRSRAWKARPARPATRDATQSAGQGLSRPTVVDRGGLLDAGATSTLGHGRWGRSVARSGGDGTSSGDRRACPRATTCLVWQVVGRRTRAVTPWRARGWHNHPG